MQHAGSFIERQRRFATAMSIGGPPAATADLYKHGLQPVTAQGAMEETLKRLGSIHMEPMTASAFIKPQSVQYELDGKQLRWDVVQTHPSVGVLIYHTELKALLLVRQFRPAVYAAVKREAQESGQPDPPTSAGFTYELCAGIIDKSKSLEEIARDEVLEECGFDVPASAFQRISTYHSSMGISGSRHTMFYMEVDESTRVHQGGGLQDTGEAIEVLALPMSNAEAFMADESLPRSAGLLFAIMWLRFKLAQRST
ncbi:hypothetical protein WJX72_005307 [[Myrmecia] bisecta]|uniref:Uridine diphosphate glucose pyrophosphatase NUDT14 n=1 Tax=[Myrmecia] bisecta TaxID=41462 RepID=A0AAW1R6U8_9CHLO